MTALTEAILNDNYDEALVLIELNEDDIINLPDDSDNDKPFPIHLCVDYGMYDSLSEADKLALATVAIALISKGVDLSKSYQGMQPLHYAAYYGQLEVVKAMLMSRRASIDALDSAGMTASNYAESQGHNETFQALRPLFAEAIANAIITSFQNKQLAEIKADKTPETNIPSTPSPVPSPPI